MTAAPVGAVIFLGSVAVEVLLHTALALEGNLRSAGSGDGGVIASFSSLVDDGIFAVDGGIFTAWFAEAGHWFLFGNDDGVERSLGRGVVFGSRFFPACPRCSSVVAWLL